MNLPNVNDRMEHLLLFYLSVCLKHDADDPLNTVSLDVTPLECVTLVLGLNRLVKSVDAGQLPDVLGHVCARLVERLTDNIDLQKLKPTGADHWGPDAEPPDA